MGTLIGSAQSLTQGEDRTTDHPDKSEWEPVRQPLSQPAPHNGVATESPERHRPTPAITPHGRNTTKGGPLSDAIAG